MQNEQHFVAGEIPHELCSNGRPLEEERDFSVCFFKHFISNKYFVSYTHDTGRNL
jgi:hypothetical protein